MLVSETLKQKYSLNAANRRRRKRYALKKQALQDRQKREKGEGGEAKAFIWREKKKPVEKWYYNCRGNDFIYVLTCEWAILKSEEA
ncbi:MAG: hypothetical protein ABSC57_04550 [Syntrophales bacterium]